MTIPCFIQAAKDGGFTVYGGEDVYTKDEEYFLSPKAWEAVGKVKGWDKYRYSERNNNIIKLKYSQEVWVNNMFKMVYALTEGRTLEEYIATL